MASLSTTERGAARRAEILAAARTCFLRDGFHATSMQDLLKASGLSAGAFYRYFPSKQAIVLALCEAAIGEVAALAEMEPAGDPPSLEILLGRILQAVETLDAANGSSRLAILIWGEAQRDPELRRIVVEAQAPLFRFFEKVVVAHKAHGRLRAEITPPDTARAIAGIIQGFIAQHALLGTSAADYHAGLAGLLATWL